MATLTSPTLERLITEARLFLRQPDATNSTWSDTELTVYANDAIRTYFLEINERAEGQFDKVINLDIVSDSETVDLPTDFFEVRSLYKKANTEYKIMKYVNDFTDSFTNQGGTSGTAYLPYYFFRGNAIVLRPVPNFSETAGLRLEYTAFPETLIWGGDQLTSGISPIFKELVVMYIVYKAKLSDSANNGDANGHTIVAAHLGDLYQKFKETVGYRSKYPITIKPWNP